MPVILLAFHVANENHNHESESIKFNDQEKDTRSSCIKSNRCELMHECESYADIRIR